MLRSHPRIIDRINSVNSLHRNAQGRSFFQLDPKCVYLHKDFEMVDMEMLTKMSDVGDRTHASDAIGYMIHYRYPITPGAIWTAK